MKGMLSVLVLSASLGCMAAQACDVDIEAAYLDEEYGNYIIPVTVERQQRCVVQDHQSEAWKTLYRELWQPVEKLGVVTPERYGRFIREYQVEGDVVERDRYVFIAGDKAGTDMVVFSAFPDGQEQRALAYRISVQ